jgi:DNA-binding NtrC family response regulator
MKILVVDDDPIVLDSCRRVFGAEGFEVKVAPSADKGLEALGEDGFQLLLIDVKMPVHDGMWLIEKIKQVHPGIPIVVMSGYPVTETIATGFRLGAATFIAKPFTPDELLGTVREALGKGRGHEADQSSGD